MNCRKAPQAAAKSFDITHIIVPISRNIRAVEEIMPISQTIRSPNPARTPITAGLCFWKYTAAYADMANTPYILRIVY